jgi:RND family efflux transporter MFP subunit
VLALGQDSKKSDPADEEALVLQQLHELAKNKNAGFSKRGSAWLAAAKRGLPAKTAVPELVDFLEELKLAAGKMGVIDLEQRQAMKNVLLAVGIYGKDAEPALPVATHYFETRWEIVPGKLDNDINAAAAWALGKIASAKCLPAFFTALAENKETTIREAAIRALAAMARTKDFPKVQEVIARLHVAAKTDESGINRALADQFLMETKPIKVDVSMPIAREVIEYKDFTGRVEAANKVLIQAMVTGYLVKRNFVDGDEVVKGQVLFEIDPTIYHAKWEVAKAAKEMADADLVRTEAAYQLNKPLEGKSVSSEQIKAMESDYLKAKALVILRLAEVKQAKDNLDYTLVRSPIHGKASRRMIDTGNMVEAQKTQLTYVYAIDPMYGYFDVDERTVIEIRKLINKGEMPDFRQGKIEVKVGLANEDGFSMVGYIDYVDQVLDAGTGTLKMRCVIFQPRTQGGELVSCAGFWPPLPVGHAQVLVSPGMFVRVRLPIGRPKTAMLVAERAVGAEQGKKFINLVGADNKVVRKYVELGQMHYGLRVVNLVDTKDSLKATDLVVVNYLQRVGPGKEVVATVVPMPQYTPVDAPAVNAPK